MQRSHACCVGTGSKQENRSSCTQDKMLRTARSRNSEGNAMRARSESHSCTWCEGWWPSCQKRSPKHTPPLSCTRFANFEGSEPPEAPLGARPWLPRMRAPTSRRRSSNPNSCALFSEASSLRCCASSKTLTRSCGCRSEARRAAVRAQSPKSEAASSSAVVTNRDDAKRASKRMRARPRGTAAQMGAVEMSTSRWPRVAASLRSASSRQLRR
mmetsp:Transcript_11647/g.25303  ORF Transcript_11647/g.25303 Transcript_11647/m.25303 type:complete len:213 (-) Transcript_11647:646-1284(-)